MSKFKSERSLDMVLSLGHYINRQIHSSEQSHQAFEGIHKKIICRSNLEPNLQTKSSRFSSNSNFTSKQEKHVGSMAKNK